MRARTQNAHIVPHQNTRVKGGSKRREECTELTNQMRQLRSPKTLNQKTEGVTTLNSRRSA